VQPSSLIFLVLIAFWAAFLLQHWVRRREYLATARSVDRFSEAMRVLERRSPLPEYELSGPPPRSCGPSPARADRPEIVGNPAPPPRPDTSSSHVSADGKQNATTSRVSGRPKRSLPSLAGGSSRRVRGLSLLASASLAMVVSPLAAFAILPWWSFLVVLATLIADLIWLRAVAVSEVVTRRVPVTARRSAVPPARRPAYLPDYFESVCESESPFDFRAESVTDPSLAVGVDIEEPTQAPAPVDPSAWAPVPVPPPTYTLKAKAADPAVPTVVVEPQGAEYWSLEGLVYDCELDELVDRRSATGA
jgi:hypothetical protein